MILHITNFQGGGRTGGEVNWVFPKFLLQIGFNNEQLTPSPYHFTSFYSYLKWFENIE